MRGMVIVIVAAGWLAFAGGLIAPLVGMAMASTRSGSIATDIIQVPGTLPLLYHSLTLSAVATAGSMLLGTAPGLLLGSVRGRAKAAATGLILMPLLVPPQVFAYAWQLATSPSGPLAGWFATPLADRWADGAVRVGLVSSCWLWPVVALIVAAGWRATGRAVIRLAVLDASTFQAIVRAGLPSMRLYLLSAACLVFAITMIEYPIPHLMLCRVWATELLMLVDVGAPFGQVMRMALAPMVIITVVLVFTAISIRATRQWSATTPEDTVDLHREARWSGPRGVGVGIWLLTAMIWGLALVFPVWVLLTAFNTGPSWRDAFVLLAAEWGWSLVAALAAGSLTVALTVATMLVGRSASRPWVARASSLSAVVALIPPAAVGIGFIVIFNQPGIVGSLYTRTPWVWILALVSRYAAIPVLVAWLATGRHKQASADQARSDGAGHLGVLAHVLLPADWRPLLAAGLIVCLLALSEVVITHVVGPIGFPSIALTILAHMHYGRDDMVITASLSIMMAGGVITMISGWMLTRRDA